ncbi:putative glycosyl transferase [compost metagenome]
MFLSIIVPTVDRGSEFDRFMQSLVSQPKAALTEIELIIVDQNQDDRIAKILKETEVTFSVTHMKALKNGVSAAKNIGMRVAQGKFCCFLDDDCWLSSNWLDEVLTVLKNTSPRTGILIKAISPDGENLLPHIVPTNFQLSEKNIKDAFNTPQISHIYPHKECLTIGGFNEQLGTGIFLGSTEETDFLVRIVKTGLTFIYEPNILILHNRVDYTSMSPEKSYQYGLGFGAFCRLHGWHAFWLYKIIRSLAGFLIYFTRNKAVANAYFATFRGRVHGYFLGK